jgi:chromosome segregation ATPase
MKPPALTSAFILVLTAPAVFGQWLVNDPINTAVNTAIQSAQAANHLEVLRQWAEQLEKLNRQIRQLEEQLAEQRRIREVLGNPSAAGAQLILDRLAPADLARTYGETLAAVRRLADATTSLRRTAEGIYEKLEDRTVLGREFPRQTNAYRRYAAVDQQAEQASRVSDETDARIRALQADLAATLAALRAAPTQAEVDKLNVKVAALNGQLAVIAAQRRDEADKLHAQQIQNENQAAKERQDLLEKQIAEERQSLSAVNAWQRSVRLTADSYSRP